MYYFSEHFTDGLRTKSQNFQNKFYEIVDEVAKHMATEDERREFQKYIEENHSYDKPGNILFSSRTYFCGKQSDVEKLKEKIHVHLLSLFDSFEAEDAMVEVPHIIVCISTANTAFAEADMNFLKSIINFERICRGQLPALITTVLGASEAGTSCFVACLK